MIIFVQEGATSVEQRKQVFSQDGSAINTATPTTSSMMFYGTQVPSNKKTPSRGPFSLGPTNCLTGRDRRRIGTFAATLMSPNRLGGFETIKPSKRSSFGANGKRFLFNKHRGFPACSCHVGCVPTQRGIQLEEGTTKACSRKQKGVQYPLIPSDRETLT